MPQTVHVQLKSMMDSLAALAGMGEKVAPIIADVARADIRRSIAEGTTPYGEPWKLTLDGKVPLRGAMKAVSVTAVGRVVYVRVDGVEALHHLGAVRGKIKRRIIPSKKRLPDRMALAIRAALDKWFEENVVQHG